MALAKILAVVTLVSLTLGAGLQVDRDHLRAILKNIGLLGRALLANFVIVPLLGVLIAKVFRLPGPIATGFLLMAIAPGVPFVLAQVRKRGGSLGFAVALAFFLPLLSIVTVPITADLVLPTAAKAQLPMARFVMTLVLFQLVPLLVGIIAGGTWPTAAAKLARWLQIVFFATAILLVVSLMPTIARDVGIIFGSGGMWAAFCLVILSLGSGWLLAGPRREDRRVLAIGTGLRNIGLGALIATSSFGRPEVAAMVIAYFLIQFIVVSIVGVYFTRTAEKAPA
ncbi:MAG: bile acid:sodium symporter [Candidatus Eremiobacteraeota bacterium]|nr:bile acid:sodium symporter [Candidatus Eremiobacteraeota bacterium]